MKVGLLMQLHLLDPDGRAVYGEVQRIADSWRNSPGR
jgi:hypothetical protein